MPGIKLNDTEKQLKKFWENSNTPIYPFLREIQVKKHQGGLRGIDDLQIKFPYPITVLCGANGAGKTTLLALACLAFHGVENHVPNNARRIKDSFGYYTFQDFFFKGPNDPDVSGLEITWHVDGVAAVSLRKQSSKWMRYERRPTRAVDYLGVSRIVPPIERTVLRAHFPHERDAEKVALNDEYRKKLSEILGRKYASANLLKKNGYLSPSALSKWMRQLHKQP